MKTFMNNEGSTLSSLPTMEFIRDANAGFNGSCGCFSLGEKSEKLIQLAMH
jgi:hypothetical protein